MLLINTAKMINKLAEMERLSAEAHLGLSEALSDKVEEIIKEIANDRK